MDKKVLYTVVGVGLILIFGWSLFNNKNTNQSDTSQETKQNNAPSFKADITVVNLDESLTDYKVKEEGLSALEALKKVTKGNLEVKGEGENAFVQSINGRNPDESSREYWAFYINDKLSEVGAGSYIIKNADKIKWKIERY